MLVHSDEAGVIAKVFWWFLSLNLAGDVYTSRELKALHPRSGMSNGQITNFNKAIYLQLLLPRPSKEAGTTGQNRWGKCCAMPFALNTNLSMIV